MIETKPKVKNATVDIWFELVGSRQQVVAARSRMFNHQEVSCVLNVLGNVSGKNLKYHAPVAISRVMMDKTILQRIHGRDHVKNIKHIGSEEMHGTKCKSE